MPTPESSLTPHYTGQGSPITNGRFGAAFSLREMTEMFVRIALPFRGNALRCAAEL
jgi:hypothetical protein